MHWPDGLVTKGIEQHIADLKAMFVYAQDTRIKQHPVAFGSGEWTSVIGIMDGTFTKPMPLPNGQSLAPTGKAFKVRFPFDLAVIAQVRRLARLEGTPLATTSPFRGKSRGWWTRTGPVGTGSPVG